MTDITASAAAPAVAFDGRRKPLFWLLIRNGLLTVVTLGFYRFWARTKLRRYYWNNITIAGDPMEYTGRGLELFLGFLIAIAVLIPLSLLTTAISFALASVSPGTEFIGNVVFFVALIWLIGFAIFRARRYRLTRTRWRGIRAGQTGSAVRYATLRLGLTFIALLTLGLAYPWTRIVLHRYAIQNTMLGNQPFAFDGAWKSLFRYWIPVQASVVLIIAAGAANVPGFIELNQLAVSIEGGEEVAFELPESLKTTLWLLAGAYILTIITFVWFRVAEIRYIFNNMTIAGATAESRFKFRSVLLHWALIVFSFFATIALIVAGFWIMGKTGDVAGISIFLSPVALLGGLAVFVFASLVLFTIQHMVFWAPILRKFCRTLTISNTEALDRVVQSTAQDPKYAEGLVDALEVDMPI